MEKRNIYKTDDVLIIGSFLMLVPAVYFSWAWFSGLSSASDLPAYLQAAPEILGPNLIISAAYLAGAVFTQILGRVLRHQENQTRDILDTVMYMGRVSLSQLSSHLSLSEGKVRRLAVRLCRVRALGIHLEGEILSRRAFPEAAPFTAEKAAEPIKEVPPEQEEKPSPKGSSPLEKNEASPITVSPELRDFLKQDKSDIFSKLDQLNRIAESGGEITPDELEKASKEKNSTSKGKIILFLILFMTPLWPIPLIFIIIQVVKNFKRLKKNGMVDLNFGPEK